MNTNQLIQGCKEKIYILMANLSHQCNIIKDIFVHFYRLVCGNNTYGLECRYQCGNCSIRNKCHHVNGSCPYGCAYGWSGIKCDKGKIWLLFLTVGILFHQIMKRFFCTIVTFYLYNMGELIYLIMIYIKHRNIFK